MSDFDPVAEAQKYCAEIREVGFAQDDEEVVETCLVSYIDALVIALDDTDGALRALDRNRQTVTSLQVDAMAHTNRHLLP